MRHQRLRPFQPAPAPGKAAYPGFCSTAWNPGLEIRL
jgi:hypothetical protein